MGGSGSPQKKARVSGGALAAPLSTWGAGAMEEILTFSAEQIPLPVKVRQFLKAPGYENTALSVIPAVPLNVPGRENFRPRATPAVKQAIFDGMDFGSLVADVPAVAVSADAEPALREAEDTVIVYHHARHDKLALELLSSWIAKVVIAWTLGLGSMIRAAIRLKITAIGWYRNQAHKKLIEEDIIEWLVERMADPSDERFYIAPEPAESLEIPEETA